VGDFLAHARVFSVNVFAIMIRETANNEPDGRLLGRFGGALEVERSVGIGKEGAGDPAVAATNVVQYFLRSASMESSWKNSFFS
jgi:hypothetical protein